MLGLLGAIFSGGTVGAVTEIAKEFIQTDKESAEAKALLVKVLDPNGIMRRQLSMFASTAYGFFLLAIVVLTFMSVWEVGGETCNTMNLVEVCTSRADIAAGRLAELFLPITASWGAIVSASFGVNATNSLKGRP